MATVTSFTDEHILELLSEDKGTSAGYDVILLAGQSNMEGQGSPVDTVYLDNPDPRIQQWGGSGVYLGKMVQAVDPLLHHRVAAGRIGPGVSFAKWWVRETGRQVLLVPCAHAATGFRTTSLFTPPAGYHYVANGGSWDPDATDGGFNLYDYAVAQANAAIANDPENKIVAILWQQGEGDSAAVGGTLTAAQYEARLDALIDGFRSEITGATDVPFLVGRSSYDAWYDDHPADIALLDENHLDTPVRKEFTAWVRPHAAGQLEADGIHMNAVAQRLAGGVYYPEAYALALVNEIGTAPIAPGNIRGVQSGTTLTIEWDRPLCRANDYRVQLNVNGGGWVTQTRTASTEPKQVVSGLTLGDSVQVRVATINENGTSPNSAAVTLSVRDIPAVPTGLTIDIGAWTAEANWDVAARANDYTIERQLSAGGGSVTVTSVDTFERLGALVATTAYKFRVKANNEAGSSAYSAWVNATTTAPSYLADDIGARSDYGYSVRRLSSAYVGSCMRVRRSSDNAELDIGFDANGLLNTAAILTHVGGGTGYVTKWYNQGTVGATADFVMATAGSQPTIAVSGVINVRNGLPEVVFDGTNDFMSHSVPGMFASADGVTAMAVAQTRKFNTTILAETSSTANPRYVPFYNGPSGQAYFIIGNDSGTFQAQPVTSNSVPDDDTLNQETAIDTLLALSLRRNGSATSVTDSPYTRVGPYTPTLLMLGVSTAPYWHQGGISELCIWLRQFNTNLLTAGESNQRGYYATA